MEKKCITYGKIETGTNWRVNLDMETFYILVCSIFFWFKLIIVV